MTGAGHGVGAGADLRPLTPEVLARLREAVGAEHVRTARGDLVAHSRDATPGWSALPEAVVAPATTAQVQAVLATATAARVAVTTRGGGSNLCAAAVPLRGGIVLVTSRMDQVLEVSRGELLARAQPGVTIDALGAAVAGEGLMYVPDPGSRSVATVGGSIATGAGGLRGLKHGVTRNYVLGLEVVLPTGEVLRTGGRLWKDVAGYDLTRLLTGSEGTLGVVTEATLALVPAPRTSGTAVAYFADLATAGDAVAAVLAEGVVPATLEFLDRRCIDAVEAYAHLGLHPTAGALLLLGDDGQPGAVAHSLEVMGAVCRDAGALEVTVAGDVAQAEALMHARRCSLPALSRLGPLTVLEDASVPRPRLAEMVERIGAISRAHRVEVATFGHAGDGNLHPTAVLQDAGDGPRAQALFDDVFAAALDLGGTITGEHGVGAAKLAHLPGQLGGAQYALMQRIKAAFDPAGILNPGKVGS